VDECKLLPMTGTSHTVMSSLNSLSCMVMRLPLPVDA
jgi:hypothetical protein